MTIFFSIMRFSLSALWVPLVSFARKCSALWSEQCYKTTCFPHVHLGIIWIVWWFGNSADATKTILFWCQKLLGLKLCLNTSRCARTLPKNSLKLAFLIILIWNCQKNKGDNIFLFSLLSTRGVAISVFTIT